MVCESNGIEFNQQAFDSIISSSQQKSIEVGVTGKSGKKLDLTRLALGSMVMGGFAGFIWNGSSSVSKLDTRKLVDTYLQQFQYSYNNWIKEAKISKNKK